MSDDGKVKPIRSGVKIDEGLENFKKKPIPVLIERLKFLLALAESGELQEFAYAGITGENEIYSEFLGDISAPHEMQAELVHLERLYYEMVFLGRWEDYAE